VASSFVSSRFVVGGVDDIDPLVPASQLLLFSEEGRAFRTILVALGGTAAYAYKVIERLLLRKIPADTVIYHGGQTTKQKAKGCGGCCSRREKGGKLGISVGSSRCGGSKGKRHYTISSRSMEKPFVSYLVPCAPRVLSSMSTANERVHAKHQGARVYSFICLYMWSSDA
jgi:hypothetical protein